MTPPSKQSVEEAVDIVWDVCEEIFGQEGDFHRWFISDKEQYFNFLKQSFAKVFAVPNGQAVGGIGRCLSLPESGIDRVALHYRSRRVKESDFIAWQRIFLNLTQIDDAEEWYRNNKDKLKEDPPHVDTRDYYRERSLKQHIFRKGKRNRILCFEFLGESPVEESAPEEEKVDLLSIPFSIHQSIAKELKGFLKGFQPIQNISQKIAEKSKKSESKFLNRLKQYCKNNLSDENQPSNDEERIQFLIESSLITLILLMENNNFQLPRSFILIPIFISNESIGGMAFFSKDGAKLRKNGRSLKYLAMNLLSYVSTLESRQIEAENRFLEASSPIVHLFVHSVNKAFTTPIQNICTEIALSANLLGEISLNASEPLEIFRSTANQSAPTVLDRKLKETNYLSILKDLSEKASKRLYVLDTFLSSFSKRWSGTFAALASQQMESETDTTIRFLAINDFDGRNINQELLLQVQALFAVQLANDIFDASPLSGYRPSLESLDGVNKLVDLRFNLQHQIPGSKDVMLLFLLELVQNALEALPLGQILKNFQEAPDLLKRRESGFWIQITSEEIKKPKEIEIKEQKQEEWIAIEIRDNGLGFDAEIRKVFEKYLPQFSKSDYTPPTLREIRQQIAEDPEAIATKSGGGISSKSGSALGLGIFGIADYISRICLVEWNGKESFYPDERARIVQRGKVEIMPADESKPGGFVRLLLPKEPKEPKELQASDRDISYRIVLERR